MKPTGQRYHLHDRFQLKNFLGVIEQYWLEGKKPTVQFLGEGRTTDQNTMIYALYQDIADQSEDKTLLDVRCECKLIYGVGIRKASDPEFAKWYDENMKKYDYETKLKLITHIDITSHFTKKQATDYITTIVQEYTKNGYRLADPRMAE